MIKSDQAKEIATYIRELAEEVTDDDCDRVRVAGKLNELADSMQANENVMCGIDIMRRVRAGTG